MVLQVKKKAFDDNQNKMLNGQDCSRGFLEVGFSPPAYRGLPSGEENCPALAEIKY